MTNNIKCAKIGVLEFIYKLTYFIIKCSKLE